jgi:predicted GTPase
MEWIHELKQVGTETLLIALVVTKKDLIYPPVWNKTAHQLAKQLNCLYFEVSALTGMGIEHLFERCIETKLQADENVPIHSISQSLLEPLQTKEKCCGML